MITRLVPFAVIHGERPASWRRSSPQISTDGFNAYPEAVDLAFGSYCKYGQLIKDYRNADQPGRYGPPGLVGTDRREIFGSIDPWSDRP